MKYSTFQFAVLGTLLSACVFLSIALYRSNLALTEARKWKWRADAFQEIFEREGIEVNCNDKTRTIEYKKNGKYGVIFDAMKGQSDGEETITKIPEVG